MTESSPNRPFADDEDPDWAGFDLKKFVLSAVQTAQFDDDHNDVLEGRLLRIEECTAARWPRRWLLWRRLRRDIRASVAGYSDEYIPRGDFIGRRMEACGVQVLRTDAARWRHIIAYREYMGQRGAEPLRGGRLSEMPGRRRAEPSEDGTDPGAGFLP